MAIQSANFSFNPYPHRRLTLRTVQINITLLFGVYQIW